MFITGVGRGKYIYSRFSGTIPRLPSPSPVQFFKGIPEVVSSTGAGNCAADGLSRQFTGVLKRAGDGHKTDVNPDWEVEAGIVNNLFTVNVEQEDNYGGGKVDMDKPQLQLRIFINYLQAAAG
ncbi:hypothetical protein FIBSPDRAFT_967672 [Athelia psychrophila]|uniref:Uncharacterized protein n=1 Tax=Athelia psychrophila TaxID=1759441 RepID=A0A167VG55_9AGAM|nr:hypothetical protein FIBSPDRAFT_967672 [Fibularhizoctonia sp. CBS 109695]